jgi:cytidine deaminase
MSLHTLHNMSRVNPDDIRGVLHRRQRMLRQTNVIPFGSRQSTDVLDIFSMPIRMPEMPPSEREIHLTNLFQVLRHARASQNVYSNLSKRHYGAMVILDNGIQSIGTNVEASRQTVFCDLRYAITNGMNLSIAAAKDCELRLPTPKVKTIYLVNATVEGDSPVPCSDCQEWLNSRFCSPDTQVISLEKNPEGIGAMVRTRTVRDMLPFHQGRTAVRLTTEKAIADLPVGMSESAARLLNSTSDSRFPEKLRKLAAQAQSAYQRNKSASADSGLRTGVAMMLSPLGQIVSGGRFDWSTRWHESADLATAVQAFQQTERAQQAIRGLTEWRWMPHFINQKLQSWLEPPKIRAVAYYGDDAQLPPLASLGRIARHRGSSETLIVTVEDDQLQMRTIADFMPEMYRKKSGS